MCLLTTADNVPRARMMRLQGTKTIVLHEVVDRVNHLLSLVARPCMIIFRFFGLNLFEALHFLYFAVLLFMEA